LSHALRASFSIEEIFNLTKIDRWFLVLIKEIVDFEEELAGAKIQIRLLDSNERPVRQQREKGSWRLVV